MSYTGKKNETSRFNMSAAARRLDWQVAARVVTYGSVVWVIDSFAPKFSNGWDIIGPVARGTGPCPLLGQDFVRVWRPATVQPHGARLR